MPAKAGWTSAANFVLWAAIFANTTTTENVTKNNDQTIRSLSAIVLTPWNSCCCWCGSDDDMLCSEEGRKRNRKNSCARSYWSRMELLVKPDRFCFVSENEDGDTGFVVRENEPFLCADVVVMLFLFLFLVLAL